MKVLQEQFNEQSEKLNMIQEKLLSYTPRNINKRQKRAQSNIRDRSFFMREGELVGFGGGATQKKLAWKGGPAGKKWREGGGVGWKN